MRDDVDVEEKWEGARGGFLIPLQKGYFLGAKNQCGLGVNRASMVAGNWSTKDEDVGEGRKIRRWMDMSHGCCLFFGKGIRARDFFLLLIITSWRYTRG
jgi:hypothetical protein